MAIKIISAPEVSARYWSARTARIGVRLPLVSLLSALMWPSAHAVEFSLGEVAGRFDSNLSIGASWRMEDADSSTLSQFNGGTLASNGVNDDGNLNFKKHDVFTKTFKGVHDLSLTYDNVGAFVRGKYWYDFELKDGDQAWGHGNNGYAAGQPLNDDGFNDYAKFSGAEILDAFVYGNFDLGEMPATVRLGRQVVSWGESTFIQGGINAINPIDVAAFRRPGAEVKEGLLPVNMLFGSLGVTDAVSVEGFYQLQWEETAIDGCGTYFSNVDYIAQGCNKLTLGAVAAQTAQGLGAAAAAAAAGGNAALAGALAAQANGLLANSTSDAGALSTGWFVDRAAFGAKEPKDEGQFGIALRYFAEELNATEFGLYYLNYHSRLPVASGITTGANQMAGDLNGDGNPDTFLPTDPLGQNPVYFSEFPEDISLLGLSFSTSVGDVALSGEISHHMDLPIQINGADLVGSILSGGTQTLPGGGANPMNGRVGAAFINTVTQGLSGGTVVNGYDRYDVTQAQVTGALFVDRVLGASRLTLVGELAANHIHGFDNADQGGIRYGRASEFGQAGSDGFVTQNSWGYRARAILSYPDAIAGVNLKPSIAWAHDVDGYSPVNTGFVEGRKAISLGLSGEYRNTYSAGISYTRFSGDEFDTIKDRDFLSLNLGVSF